MYKINAVTILFSLLTIIIISCDNKNHNNVRLKTETNSKNTTEIKTLSDKQVLGLKDEVEFIKQEEYYATNPDQQIGYKTGENSFIIKLNKNGQQIEHSFLDNEGALKEISTYQFDINGVKIGKIIKNTNGEMISIYQYEYDNYGRMIKYKSNELKEAIEYYTEYKYDNDGNEISSTMYAPDGTKMQSANYDYKNGIKSKLELKDNLGILYSICEYSNNEFGDVIKEKYYTGNNMLFEEYHNEYKYDGHNNWIMKKYFLDKKGINSVSNENKKEGIQTITMRTLTYR